jgi:outer membrane protein assembly factor BamE (lipoprotein component of BamABCDE complex)
MDARRMNCKLRIAAAVLAAFGLSACSSIVDTRGNMPSPDLVAQVKPGDDRERVRKILGSPTSTGAFDQGKSAWYYIARKTETTAFLPPSVVDSQVVIVRFDDRGFVADVDKRGAEAAAEVEVTDRETPTAGHAEGIIAQLFGNVGRFNKAAGGRPVSTNIPGR